MTRRRIVGFFLAVALLTIVEFVPPLRNSLVSGLSFVNPVEGFTYRQSNSFRRWLVRLIDERGAEEFAILQEQVGTLGVDRIALLSLQAENDKLKKLLNLHEAAGRQTVPTRVVGRDPRDPATLIRLSAGARDGVQVGAAVVDPDNFFVAKVVEVGQTTSAAVLLQSRRLKLGARVLGRDRMVGILESGDGLSLHMRELPKSGDVAIGDIVVTSGDDGVLPNLPLGSILSISGNPEELFREAIVAPLASPKTADIVNIIVTTNAPQ